MTTILSLTDWFEVIRRGTSGDQVTDILYSWKAQEEQKDAEIEHQRERIAELEAEKEQVCEWKQETSLYDNVTFFVSPHDQYATVCGKYQMTKNVYCLTCGKRIKYIESEK